MLNTAKLIGFSATKDPSTGRKFYEATPGLRVVEETPYAIVFDANGTMLRLQILGTLGPVCHTTLGWDVADIVRRASEFATGHLRGAKNIAHTRLHARLAEVSAAPFVLVHCQTGIRALRAIAFLRGMGHEAVVSDDAFASAPRERMEQT